MLRPHSAPPLKASVLSRERSAAIDDLSSQTAQSTRRGLTRSYPTDSLAVLLSVLIMASSEAPQTRYNEMIQQLIIAAAATVALTTGAHTLPFRLRRRSTRGWLFFVTVSSQASGFAEKAVVTSGRSTRLPSATPASLRHGERRRRRYHLILRTDALALFPSKPQSHWLEDQSTSTSTSPAHLSLILRGAHEARPWPSIRHTFNNGQRQRM